jgi:hypothetical protein
VTSSSKLFEQVDAALSDARILDRDLIRDLLELSRALEIALLDACRTNLETRLMDRNVVNASNSVREAIDSLNSAFAQSIKIDANELDNLFEAQLMLGRKYLQDKAP